MFELFHQHAVIILAAIVAIGVVAVALLLARGRGDAYRARPLMTDNELEFFFRLEKAFSRHLVFSQVSMLALLEAASRDSKTAYRDRLRIAQQRVDYVVCDREGSVLAVIELDDRTHVKSRDDIRDARLAQAGIATLRYESRAKPSVAMLQADLQALLD